MEYSKDVLVRNIVGKSLVSEDSYSHIIEEFENAGRKHS